MSAAPVPASPADATEPLRAVAVRYCEALHAGDAEALADAFMPQAHVMGVDGAGALIDWDREAFLDRARARGAGEGVADYAIRHAEAGADMGLVTLEVAVGARRFADQLAMLRTADGWRIANKTFTLLAGPPLAEG